MERIYTLKFHQFAPLLRRCSILFGIVLFLIPPVEAQYFTKILNGTLVETPKKPYSASWADYNNDGFDDMLIVDNTDYHSSLFKNNGDGTFIEITDNAIYNNMGPSIACSWGDYNNDGNIDLYICNTGNNGGEASINFLYRNDGNGVFTRITEGAIVTDQGWSLGAAWADYDNDGFLDLYVSNFVQENCLYHNNGDETFTKITVGEIVTDNYNTFSACWSDYDNDGFQDLYVVNYYYSALPGQNNCLYHNNGDGTFTKNTTALIANDLALTQGASWGDYNNDGWMDLFVTVNDFGDIKHNLLYKNNGFGNFTLVNAAPSIDGSSSFGSAWLDINNDGLLDLTVSNNGGSTKRLNYLYLNNGDETFTNQITDEATLTPIRDYCSSIADYDQNGYSDIFTPSYSTTIIHGLYKNTGGSNNWIGVRLEGTISNHSGIGSRIKCYTNGTCQTREVSSTSGQYTGSSLAQLFGIGSTSSTIDSIVIQWPSGIHQVITNPITNQYHLIVEANTANNETDILTFEASSFTGNALIDTQNHTIIAEVINGTNLTNLAPTITLSEGAIINPNSGVGVDFSNGPVNYTVTAENGTDIQIWVVTITEEYIPNNETVITAFSLSNQTTAAIIDLINHTVTAEVVNGTNLSNLAPMISISAGATIDPISGAIVDFSNGPVNYTVTAENGADFQVWIVTVTEEYMPNNETDITAFSLASQTTSAIINTINHTVTAEVSYGTDLSNLEPNISISAGATIDPISGASVDFSNGPVDYTVTAENGTNVQVWVVNITAAPVGINQPFSNTRVSIYPNPSSGDGTIIITAPISGLVNVVIYNQKGQIIMQDKMNVMANKSFELNFDNFRTGRYLIKIMNDEINTTHQLIIAN